VRARSAGTGTNTKSLSFDSGFGAPDRIGDVSMVPITGTT
jgi:hypothetical protein